MHVLSENNGNNSENEREEVFIIQGKNDATLSLPLEGKGVYIHALRGKFGTLWSQKLKVTFHQFHPIGLLEEWSKCKILAFILFFRCYGNKNSRQNRLKIEKLSF